MRSQLRVLFVAIVLVGDLGCRSKSDESGNVVQFKDDDGEMNAAMAEARQRWPEFASAYAKRNEGDRFSTKAPFTATDGRVEHLWLSVTAITSDQITGTIDNEPVAKVGHKLGDSVTVPISRISDWLYSPSGSKDMVGGFTIKVAMARQKGR